MPNQWDRRTRSYLFAVFGVTYLLNLALYLLGGYASGPTQILLPIQMLIPGIIAIVFIRGEGRTLREYGMSFGGLRYYILAYFVVLGGHALHALLAVGTGLGTFVAPGEGLADLIPGLEVETGTLLLLIFLLGPIQGLLFGLGEEFGWRGYLLDRLLPHGLAPAVIVGGVVWGLWHAPAILMGHNFPDAPYAGAVAMTLTAIPLGAVFVWLRLRSGSAVVVGFAHAVFNSTFFLGGVFSPSVSLFWTNPVGLTGFPVFALVAGLLFHFFPPELPAGVSEEARPAAELPPQGNLPTDR